MAELLTRHPDVSPKKLEAISLNRVHGANKLSVVKYFESLAQVLDFHDLEPQQIFNFDESGLSCVHKLYKIIAQKGKRVVSSTTSGERGVAATVMV